MYIVTGATGYLGRQLVAKLAQDGRQVLAVVRDAVRAEKIFSGEVEIMTADVTDVEAVVRLGLLLKQKGVVPTGILHLAASTQSAYMTSNPVETADGIVLGTKNVLELARRCGAKSMVFVSSMEVYGNLDCSDGHRAGEDELGQLDIFKARSSYPMAKRMAEHYCYAYAKEYGVPVKIARLAQTFGHGVPATDNRVFAQFARSAMAGEDIVLHTAGRSVGNYCEVDDVVRALLLILEKGENGEAYNVVNEENTMSIREMAELVAANFGNGSSKVRVEIPAEDKGYAADTGLWLSGEKLRRLGWQPTKNLVEMYRDLLDTFIRQG